MKLLKHLFVLVLLVCSIEGYEMKSVEIDGIDRKFLVHVPVEGEKGMPLVIVLHGAGGSALAALESYGWVEKADQEKFLAVFPEALPLDLSKQGDFKTNPNVWEEGSARRKHPVNDIAFLRNVIELVSKRYSTDPKRVFITGFSNGGSMAFRAGIELSDFLTAIAPVAGHFMLKNPEPKKPISLLLITGDKDPLMPLDGGAGMNPWGAPSQGNPPMVNSVLAWLPTIGIKEANKRVHVVKGGKEFIWGPKQGLEAIFVIVSNQGHEWPGEARRFPERLTGPNDGTLNATDFIWNFFKTQKPR
jgi:polyhydroxybutyrate depolymerase